MKEMSTREQRSHQRLKRRKREAQFGLANNAFGATAGAVATAQAYRAAPKTKADMQATRTGRFLLRRKINPKIAIPAAGTALVGMQLANGAMDAQSASYFGRELKTIHGKEKRMEARLAKSYEVSSEGVVLSKADGHGVNLELVEKKLPSAFKGMQLIGRGKYVPKNGALANANARTYRLATGKGTARDEVARAIERKWQAGQLARTSSNPGMRRAYIDMGRQDAAIARSVGKSLVEISKKKRRFDPEADRQRRLGAYQGAGFAGAAGLGTAAALKATGIKGLSLATPLGRAGSLVKVPAGLAAGALTSGAVGLAAYRRAKSARNERWT